MAKGTCYLQILGTGSSEVPPSLLLFTDTHRYLFNCGENLLRLCNEHKVKVARVRDVFLTRCAWENVGGVPGLAMNLRDIGVPSVRLRGPRGLADFQRASGVYMRRENVTLEASEGDRTSWDPYQDGCVTVQPVLLSPERTSSLSSESRSSPQSKKRKLSSVDNSSVAYVCRLPSVPGKFNPDQARQLGLPPGPLYAQLVKGKTVTTPDGRVIHPHDVVGPEQKGPEFIIIECPHVSFVPTVTNSPQLNPSSTQPDLIVHICPRPVFEDPGYRQWLQTFGAMTKHLLVHPDFCPAEVSLRAIIKIQLPLHLLDSRFFKLHSQPHRPGYHSSPILPLPELPNLIVGQSLLKYHFRPAKKAGVVERDALKPMADEIKDKLAELKSNEELCCKLNLEPNQYRDLGDDGMPAKTSPLISKPVIVSAVLPSEPAVTFLGTGAAVPSKYRNVTGILLHTVANRHMLLDCGEGTLTQLYACFGSHQAESILCNLSAVFISHIHTDHHIGLLRILQRRNELLQREPSARKASEQLVIIGPNYLGKWLGEYSLHCEATTYSFFNSFFFETDQDKAVIPPAMLDLGLAKLTAVQVDHCSQAFGVVLDHKDGWRVVYSGDTRPCPGLIKAGKGATLLIHEATFEHDLLTEAIARRHSTTQEAVEVAREMNAKFAILTHFSQRYPRVSAALFSDCCSQNVAVAFDGMTVTLKNLSELSALLPTMQDIFTSVVDDQDQEDPTPLQVTAYSQTSN